MSIIISPCDYCNRQFTTEDEQRTHLLFTHGTLKAPCSTGLAAKQYENQLEQRRRYETLTLLLRRAITISDVNYQAVSELLQDLTEIIKFFHKNKVNSFPNIGLRNTLESFSEIIEHDIKTKTPLYYYDKHEKSLVCLMDVAKNNLLILCETLVRYYPKCTRRWD